MAANMNDIWEGDFWGLTELTDAINIVPYVPGMADQMNIFQKKAITTLTVSIEYKDGEVYLVPNTDRGSPGTPNQTPRRTGRPFSIMHNQLDDQVLADDVQGIRAFGKSTEAETVQDKVNEKLEGMKQKLSATQEWYRLGALKGIILDSDGTTEIENLFTAFGITAPTQDFDFSSDATPVREQCRTLKRTILNAIGGYSMSSVGAFCSDSFFDQLTQNSTVNDTYKYFQDARQMRENLAYEVFEFGGVTWVNYRGNVSDNAFVADDTAKAFPLGTNGLFGEYYGPADYTETVNTPGLQFYAKSEQMAMDKGKNIEAQSNPLMLCHRPSSLVALTMTTT